MARIAGVDLPNDKRIEISLTYVFGIGRSTSRKMLQLLKIDPNIRTSKMTPDELNTIRNYVEDEIVVEGELRKTINLNIKRLMDLRCYRGIRHRKGLPTRGQRTRTNARMRKGPRKIVANKRK